MVVDITWGLSCAARGGVGSTSPHFLSQGGQAEVAVAGAEHQQGGVQQADSQQHGERHGEVSVSSFLFICCCLLLITHIATFIQSQMSYPESQASYYYAIFPSCVFQPHYYRRLVRPVGLNII